jgi:prepilin-type N-terminal cleavage/methylation domain-containing protein
MHKIGLLVIKNNYWQAFKISQQGNIAKSYHTSAYIQNDAGFSLVEMIAVTLMIGILALIALPNWLGFMNRQRVGKANDAVLAALQQAQREAKQKKLSYSVSFRTDNNIPQIAVYQGTTPSNWSNLGGDLGIKSGQIVLGTNLSHINTVSSSVTYSSSFNTTAPQTITFDYMGILAPKPTNSNAADTGLKVVVAEAQGNSGAGRTKRCVVISTIIGAMQTLKDNQCN